MSHDVLVLVSYLYIFPTADGLSFKVGISSKPRNRLSILTADVVFDVRKCIVYECFGDEKIIETMMHNVLRKYRLESMPFPGGTEFFSKSGLDTAIFCIDGLQKLQQLGGGYDLYTDNDVNIPDPIKADFRCKELGLLIRKERKKRSFTEFDMSTAIGCSRATYQKIEKGNSRCAIFYYILVMNMLDIDSEFC